MLLLQEGIEAALSDESHVVLDPGVGDEGVVLLAAVDPALESGAGELVALGTDLEPLLLHTARDVAAGRAFLEEAGAAASRAP